jgi:hypothetical protein
MAAVALCEGQSRIAPNTAKTGLKEREALISRIRAEAFMNALFEGRYKITLTAMGKAQSCERESS